jgi:glutamate-ammonia-ligase adenylyltransferase
MVNAVATGIRAPHDGIFHVDLRMRPFGQAGSGAVVLADFEQYYNTNGPAWPYERQAMVKFRCFSGNRVFGQQVTVACHKAIYSLGWFDFSAMRAMRERQVRQLVRGGSINAKLSEGGIVDCEYAVQALQLTFGGDMITLRHPNTLRVLREASRLSLIDPQIRERIEQAYVFLRELIDCLRMVRGNARDLTVPTPGSRDWQQLAHRMRSIHDSQVPLEKLEEQMQHVREFSLLVEQHCRKMRQHRQGLDSMNG